MMYSFFIIYDVSDRVQHVKQLDNKSAPYMNINDNRLKWISEILPEYINSIQKLSKQHKLKELSNETAEAVKFTA